MSDLPEDAKNEETTEAQGAGDSREDQVATEPGESTAAAEPSTADSANDAGPSASDTPAAEETPAETDAAAEIAADASEESPATTDDAGEPADTSAEDDDSSVADTPETGDVAAEASEEEVAETPAEEVKPKPAPPKSGLLEFIEEPEEDPDAEKDWYILKVAVNREPTIAAALQRRVKMHGLEQYFGDIIVPTEEQTEFTKAGKKRKVKKKLYPGYIVVNMAINDETWFLVRETGGIGDFTGAAGKPAPLQKHEIERILNITNPKPEAEGETHNISHKIGDRVRVNEGYFQNFEGVVDSIDINSGRVTVLITIFNRTAPVELEHWHIEAV